MAVDISRSHHMDKATTRRVVENRPDERGAPATAGRGHAGAAPAQGQTSSGQKETSSKNQQARTEESDREKK